MPIKGGCSNPKCMCSTGIHAWDDGHSLNGMTFGSGRLDHNGYWEFPCKECARAFEHAHPEAGEQWPYADMDLSDYKYDDFFDKQFEEFVREFPELDDSEDPDYNDGYWNCDEWEQV